MNAETEIEIVQLEEKYYDEVVDVINQGFGTKVCCFCLFSTGTYGVREYAKLHKGNPLKREIAFLAIDTSSKEVLGVMQLSKPGVPMFYNMHVCKPNEVYVDQLSVAAKARGRGVGTKLLEKAEEFARSEPGIEILTLDVLRGNKAVSLYERFGFEIISPKNACNSCAISCLVTFFFGRPFGWCHPEWGLHSMKKKLN
mmetsp:Transcript_2248/g.2720  ORF Transcript_2248/g.2720 Transcript_2248/m.2720 type:complete len:198 (-) Transcript_2248:81-674(-)